MRLHSLGGYSNFFTGGLRHILQDNVTQYIALNQMLLHGCAPAACRNWQDHLGDEVEAGNVSVTAAQHFWETRSVKHLPAKLRLRSVIARVLEDLRTVHDYRLNREGTVHSAFRCVHDSEQEPINCPLLPPNIVCNIQISVHVSVSYSAVEYAASDAACGASGGGSTTGPLCGPSTPTLQSAGAHSFRG